MLQILEKELQELETIIRQIRFWIVKCKRSVYEIYLWDRDLVIEKINEIKERQ